MGPSLVWETKIGDQNKSSVKVFFRKTTRTNRSSSACRSLVEYSVWSCTRFAWRKRQAIMTTTNKMGPLAISNGLSWFKQVKLRHFFSRLYWSWGGCWMVSELGSLKFTTINLLPAWWMLENTPPKKTAPPHLFGQMSRHKFCNSKVFTNRRVFFTNHYHHGPNFTDRPQQTQTYSNTKQNWLVVEPPIWKIWVKMGSSSLRFGVKIKNIWNHHLEKLSIFRWLPGNCEPQTPKASFPSPLSSSVVAPPRAFL